MAPLLTVEPTQAEATQAEATQNAYLTPSETTHMLVIPNDAHLPPYPQVCSPCFKWGDCEGPMFQEAIKKAYNQVVHWHRNIFKIPSGKGKMVVKELTRLFESCTDATTLESVAITAAMVLPSLILQKPHRSSKTKEHVTYIERRMKLWQEGNLVDLLKEGQTIQQQLQHSAQDKRSEEQLARSFSKLMMEGKVRAALCLITKQEGGNPMAIDQPVNTDMNGTTLMVFDVLKLKHPEGKPVKVSAIDRSAGHTEEPHPVIFERITGPLI